MNQIKMVKIIAISTIGLFFERGAIFADAVSPSPLMETSSSLPAASPMIVWARQSYESQKSQELTSLLERLAGPNSVGLHIEFSWPQSGDSQENVLEPLNVAALVVLDGNARGVDTQLMENLIARVLKISPDRGDKIEIYSVARKASLQDLLFSPQAILDLIKFFVVVVLGMLILLTISRSSQQIGASLERLATETRTHDIDVTLSPKPQVDAVSTQARARLAAMTASPATEMVNPSSAFSRSDPEMLARVLEEENSRNIAIFISALESDIAGKVLSSLSPAKQEEVALTLPQMVEPDPKEVAQLQAQIHLKLRKLILEKK